MDIIKIKVIGKNIERFIKRLNKEKIEMLELEYINYKEINIKIFKKDLKKIYNLKTIYEINILELYGLSKLKQNIKKNFFIIIFSLLSIIFLYILSNITFKIEVIHSSLELRNIIYDELKINGIEKFKFKKNYEEIENIKQNIINKYKDKIEWLEIERKGTTYIVRLEERIINKTKIEQNYQNIIAKKDAIILKIEGKKGEIIKNKNDYVKKGDIIISGEIKLNEETKGKVKAYGNVYGEVWYKANIEYPLNYYEKTKTGKSKKLLTISFLNKEFNLFFKNYKNQEKQEKIIYQNKYIPFKLSFNKLEELRVIDQKLTYEEAKEKAILDVKEKIESTLNSDEYIIDIKCLKKEEKDSTILLELFITVCENITEIQIIENNGEDNV